MLIAPQSKQVILNLKDPGRVTKVIPSATVFEYKGKDLVAVPHGRDETKVLRNLGFKVPHPVTKYYGFPGRFTPFKHQLVTVDFLVSNPRAYCLNGLGSGKSLSVLWAYDYLRSEGLQASMLIVSPLSTLDRVWADEIWRNFPHLTFQVLHGTREKRLKLLAQPADIYIINHDGLEVIEKELERRLDITHVTVDEVASFRNQQTERWASLNRVVNGAFKRTVWGLTGTPIPNAPTDAYGQCKLITPETVPRWFGKFRDLTMRKVTQFKWAPRDDALQTVQAVMQPAIRYSREECIDLPECLYETLHVEFTKEQKEMYKTMLNHLHLEFKGQSVSAVNEAVKLNKCLQIGCGVVYDDGQEEVYIPVMPRINVVKDIIEEAGAKVIVFVPYTGALEHIAKELRKHFTVEVVHGGTSLNERNRIYSAFQSSADPRVLVANAAAMSHGLTLTAANTVIWFSPTHSNETYEQANGRITRPGQKNKQLIIHIEGSEIERRVYTRLRSKQKVQGALLDMVEEMK